MLAELCGYVKDINDSDELVDTVESFIEFASNSRTLELLPTDVDSLGNPQVPFRASHSQAEGRVQY